jgi:hypothetical protein
VAGETVSLKEYMDALLRERSTQVETALSSINQRLALLNELRGNVATRDQLEAINTRLTDLTARIQGKTSAVAQSWAVLVGAVTIAGVVGGILARLLK